MVIGLGRDKPLIGEVHLGVNWRVLDCLSDGLTLFWREGNLEDCLSACFTITLADEDNIALVVIEMDSLIVRCCMVFETAWAKLVGFY